MTNIIFLAALVLIVANVAQMRRLKRYARRRKEKGQTFHLMFQKSREDHVRWLTKKDDERRTEKSRIKAMRNLKS